MNQRDLVLVPFPCAEKSKTKVRPALVVSNDAYNEAHADVLLCAVTSNIRSLAYEVSLPNTPRPSVVRGDTIQRSTGS